jgi:hypothetical protein
VRSTRLASSHAGRLIAVLLCVLMVEVPVLAQEQPGEPDPGQAAESGKEEGAAAGARAGKSAGSISLWVSLGFFLNLIGVGLALAVVPSPEVSHLLGRPSNYVAGYINGYRSARRWAQFRWAAIGCGAAVLLATAVVLLAAKDGNGQTGNCSNPLEGPTDCANSWSDCANNWSDCFNSWSDCMSNADNCLSFGTRLSSQDTRREVLALHRLGLLPGSEPVRR